MHIFFIKFIKIFQRIKKNTNSQAKYSQNTFTVNYL